MSRLRIEVQRDDFDIGAELALIAAQDSNIGAIVTFSGLCRDEAGTLSALEIEHYPGMAEAEIRRTALEAMERWPLTGLTIIHRYGLVRPGDNIVLILAASTHRHAAFDAASFLMDYLKNTAPFWKKEHFIDGTDGGWVEAKSRDEDAFKRWHSL
ncbi:molybdenum cofactor biosynthesis protein MoaE [Phyllobacterium sp. 21LDTY02-6]|nr:MULTISPECIES: molybdenum cofactor biosynthesis protein MoaE [unclassified Phyllobacterium]MCO4319734.1 molybdenum cofactor biosynthesis protein MoaE [Phyllobacterium sp. 21LDTY02-6]MCX8280476.1 molybdenum cofactor biosynthesis protein MoaE [Phyllobacterium sp. 0TCS1.6C]MCX8295075.1 molybdenum cofactor biosynthesis protein MoaE [Phyllobacterium sp. 0TCS1.6A]